MISNSDLDVPSWLCVISKRRSKRACGAAPHAMVVAWKKRHILRDEVKQQERPVANLGSRIAARFTKSGLTTELPELRGQVPRIFGRCSAKAAISRMAENLLNGEAS